MATIFTRTWTSRGPSGRRVRHSMYGYDAMIAGKRERRCSAEWQTDADAMEALTQALKAAEAGRVKRPTDTTLGGLAYQYLAYKADKGKRSLKEDRRILTTGSYPPLARTFRRAG